MAKLFAAGEGSMKRSVAFAIVATLVIGFGGGFLVAKAIDAASAAGGSAVPWSLFGKPRASDAPRQGIARPAGFAVWTSRLDTSGAQPLACIVLSRPLDPARSYGDFVLVSPELGHPPAVSAKGDELCVGGIGFADRRITLLRGLPDQAGDTLAANADVDFTFGDKPPYVGFAGNGVILPREESDGVGIETINVSKLAVEVWRVSDRNLVRNEISAPDPTAEGEYGDYFGDTNDAGRVVWKGLVTVAGDPGVKATTVFPLGAVLKEMSPGGYVIKVKDASGGRDLGGEDGGSPSPARAQRWIMFTDMALTAYSGADALDVVVRSLKTAKTLAGAKVALMAKDGDDLAVARTDSLGRVSFAHALLAGKDASAPKMVMAYGAQGDLAVLDLDRSPVDLSAQAGRETDGADQHAIEGRTSPTAVDGYVYGDRGIYRPGEKVHLTALVRDRSAQSVNDRKGYILVNRPTGVEFKRFRFTDTAGGAVLADVDLPKSAPRGRWTAELHIDGFDDAAGAFQFAVEDFAPQRLAVAADAQQSQPVTGGQARAIDVTARFLYGAVGSGLPTQGEARLRVDSDPFPKYAGFLWGDQTKPFEEKELELGSTVTDGAGRAHLALAAAAGSETADPLLAAVSVSVFEPGGRPVRQDIQLSVRNRPVYLGVKVEQGATWADRAPPVAVDVIAVDAYGRRVATPAVSYALVAEDWSYEWFQQNGRWQWRRSSRDVVVARGALEIGAGAAARLLRRLDWGDYRLELDGPGGARTVRNFSVGWGAPQSDATAPDVVRVSAGPKTWTQGDTVELAIKGPYGGQAQVAVATDHLIDFKTLAIGPDGAKVALRTTPAWGGGAYVMVTIIQPRDPVATPLPRRALGIAYVPLDPKGQRLTLDIGTPMKLDSRAPVDVPVKVEGLGLGQRAYVTLAAVDEGILGLTRFESPDPVKWYFGKRALSIEYRDDYGRLLDPNLGAPANVAFGGDELGAESLTVTPIKTVALWSGVVRTGTDGRAVVRLPAAQFNGQLRIMGVAWTDKAVGAASKPLTVREAVVADLNLPRFVSPGDRPIATLELHNLEGQPGNYSARTFAGGGILASFREVFRLLVGQRIAAHIPFLAPARTGVGAVGFQVAGPGFSTTKSYGLQTRLGWGPIVRSTIALQRPGEAFTPPAELLDGLAAGDVQLQVSYSPFKGFDPAAIALSLERYPFGCTEQLVSVGYPLLYAGDVSTDPSLRRGLAETVGRLIDRQSDDGAFGLWGAGDGEADPWLGAYATDFLIEARGRGAPVPDAVIDKALGAMVQISRPQGFSSISYRLQYPASWTGDPARSKALSERVRSRASAYALYVLAKSGRGDLPRLRWWHDVQMKTERSPLAMAQVGAGLALMGDRARARSALLSAVGALGYRDPDDYYQSPLRDLAGVVALSYQAGYPGIARALQQRLEGAVKDPDRLNTEEEARLMEAAHYMLKAAGPIQVAASGVQPLPSVGGAPRWAVGRLADARFVNRGSGPLWRTVTVRGTPLASPPTIASGIYVTKTFYTPAGRPVDPARVRQGDRIIVRIAGRSTQGHTVALAVSDLLPAGFEIETDLGPADAQSGPFKFLGKLTPADGHENRDDRYVATLSLGGNQPFAFAYVARAVTPGQFYLPGVEAADMYHRDIAGRTAGGRLTITPVG